MSRVVSRSSIDHLELNPRAFANKLPTYLHAKQSNRRGKSSVVQDMMRFYVSDVVESDVRRCIRSWEHQHSISFTGRTEKGEIKCFSGTVEAVARAPGSCHWRVVAGYNEGTKTHVWIIRCGRRNCNKRA
jgi:hypothetical protein